MISSISINQFLARINFKQVALGASLVGYYLGTLDYDCTPYSRESEEYWKTREGAEAALNSPSPRAWTQRLWP